MFKRKPDDDCEGSKVKVLKEDTENELKTKLKYFLSENKLTKENVWHTDFIENFHMLATKHISTVDWRLVGKFLEMATKVYEMRLESLYNDAVQTNRALKINKNNEPSEKRQANDKEQENTTNLPQITKRPVIKRKSSKVTQNPETLNKRLHVHSVPNPIFAKITSTIANRSKDMLTNILSSNESSLTMPGDNVKFWDSNSQSEVDANADLATVHDIENLGAIRSSLETYRINSEPLESLFSVIKIDLTSEDDDGDVEMEDLECKKSQLTFRTCDSGIGVNSLGNLTQLDTINDLDVQFDAEAAHDDKACNLQDQSDELELSMMPTTAEEFEYSYQSKEFIENHWAGPSYWKFHRRASCEISKSHRSMKRHKSTGIIYVEDVVRKRFKLNDTLYEDMREQNNLNRPNILYRRHTLPMDFEVSPDFVDHFSTSKNLDIYAPITNQVADSQYFSETEDFGLAAMDTTEMEPENFNLTSDGTFEVPPKFESTRISGNFNDISQNTFEGHALSTQLTENISSLSITPSQFEPRITSSQYKIPNQTQKFSNIKDIKSMCQTVLESEHNLTGLNGMSFTELTKKTTKMLEGMHTSTALNFQAILHLVNENKLEIDSEFNNIDDFFVTFK